MIIFTHVPKTSGTSFQQSLIAPNVDPNQVYVYHGLRRFLRDRGFNRSVVWGHVPFGLHNVVRRDVRYITFLRDPVDRAVSYYYFLKESDPAIYKHPERDVADALSIREFFAHRRYQNWQARYLAGLQYHYLYPHFSTDRFNRATVHRAIANLSNRYFFFGLQERFEESLDLLQGRLGWPERVKVSRQKATGVRPALSELDSATRSSLREANWLDCALYEVALERFEAQRRLAD